MGATAECQMTIIDLVTFGPILAQLEELERELAEQRRYTEELFDALGLALERQHLTGQLLVALRRSVRTCADEHGRARLAAGDLHKRQGEQ
jgi:hypothetical protein